MTMSAQKSSEAPVGVALPRLTVALATWVAAEPLLHSTGFDSGFAGLGVRTTATIF